MCCSTPPSRSTRRSTRLFPTRLFPFSRALPGLLLGVVLAAFVLAGCDEAPPAQIDRGDRPADAGPAALVDMTPGDTYAGVEGGLYPDGSNVMPDAHAQEGRARARRVEPLDASGAPSDEGRYVLLSIGHNNTSGFFCAPMYLSQRAACDPLSFQDRSRNDPDVDTTHLAIVNGAGNTLDAAWWESPYSPAYDVLRDFRLAPRGLTEAQVQVVWLQATLAYPPTRAVLPDTAATAYRLTRRLGHIARALKSRYPNLQQVFVSSRVYGGYADRSNAINPEPFAYENGFAFKWLVEAQIEQMRGAPASGLAGNLDYARAAPWIAWGPYLWSDGDRPRRDGFLWLRTHFKDGGFETSPAGVLKGGKRLHDFFTTSDFTRCWFLADGACN